MMRPYPRPATIGAALNAAARYVQRYGWTSEHYLYDTHDDCARRCECHRSGYYPASILGAVRAALIGRAKWFVDTTMPGTQEAYVACLDHLNHHLTTLGAAGLRAPALVWQAAPSRTARQVAGALRAAASTAPPGALDPFALAPVIDLAERRPVPPPPGMFPPTRPAA